MPSFRRFVCGVTVAAASVCLVHADVPSQEPPVQPFIETPQVTQAPPPWLNVLLEFSVENFLAPLLQLTPEPLLDPAAVDPAAAAETAQPVAACPVAPLEPIEDPSAQQFEAGSGNIVNVSAMEPAAARALQRFDSRVTAVGGIMVLKSAFRPAAYQQHLQNVWYKWMNELRDNTNPACQDFRAQVQDEFTRHHLIETQHPVTISDHTRGLAFDATVDLPVRARSRRRISVDALAHLAGLIRPAILADPVHFKYVGRMRRTRNS